MTVSVRYLDDLEFTFAPWSWPFAEDHRREIDGFFHRECEINPALWNGRLLLLRKANIGGGVMSGSFFETDYASLLAALDWGAMGENVRACFPAAAVLSSDGAFIFGEMAEHTRNAGQLLPPSGSVERSDVVDGRVNIFGTLQRELMEETGMAPDRFEADEGWYAVPFGPRLPLIKIMRANEVADDLRKRICENLAGQTRPEFCEIVAVRRASDLDGRMPAWVAGFVRHFWQQPPFAGR